MSFIKHGSPEPIEPEASEQQRTAAKEAWTPEDTANLQDRATSPDEASVESRLPTDDGVPIYPDAPA